MNEKIKELFIDKLIVQKIQKKLPKFFHMAELESCRAGKVGMEVGSLREKILVALFVYRFGEENVQTEIPITESEIDVKVFNIPISIKTITGKNFGGVKLIWTVDAKSALSFRKNYLPSCDMLFVQINWNDKGGMYYISKENQLKVFEQMGCNKYIKLPKKGTNPRGVEITAEALRNLINYKDTLKIEIDWKKEEIVFNAYKRWVDFWSKE